MHKILLTEMNRTNRIIEMWKGTGMWDKCSEKRRNINLNAIKLMIEASENDAEYVMWLARIIRRGLLSVADGGMERINADLYGKKASNKQSLQRAQTDYDSFVGSNSSAFFAMLKNIRNTDKDLKTHPLFIEVPDIRKGVQQLNPDGTPKFKRELFRPLAALHAIKLTKDVKVTGGTRQIDRPVAPDPADPEAGSVYQDINEVLSPLGKAKDLPRGERILDFEDGMYWTFVDKPTCTVEGALMNHCGNADPDPGDSIVSLRKPNSQGVFVPALTFIYNKKQNNISEMKARDNSNPPVIYHKYIADLLSNPTYPALNIHIKYLRGGRYLPPKNFSLNNMAEELFKQVCQKNPELIKTQIEKAEQVSPEQKLDKQHIKWFEETKNSNTNNQSETKNSNTNNQNETNSTIRYMLD